MNAENNSNTSSDYQVDRSQVYRQHQRSGHKFQKAVESSAWIILLVSLLFSVLMPGFVIPLSIVFFITGLLFLSINKSLQWEWKKPVFERMNKEVLSSFDITEDDGIIYLGREIDKGNKSLWLSPRDLTEHVLLLGTTGSGKTQLLLAMMYQFMLLGSGFIFCDGKADVKTWAHIYTLARDLGLEDNVLVLNFMTAGDSQTSQKIKISNTMNPFSYGSSDVLMEMLSGFMGKSSGSDSIWRDRAEALGRALLRGLCELRDKNEIVLSVDRIRYWMQLHKLEKLSTNPQLSKKATESILYYLNELPGWRMYKEASMDPDQKDVAMEAKMKAYEQHGYLTMQFTNILESLTATYAHITKTDVAEIDFKDVIVNRRLLYIMLPALEKSPETIKKLGQMIVTSIRNALSRLLGGDQLTGDKRFLIDASSTIASIPFPIILDEYGSYAVEGFGDIGAQARSLNMSLWYAGQEYETFKKGSAVEAERIYSNTGIKIFMKTESDLTANLASKRSGKAYVYTASQVERVEGLFSDATRETGRYNIQKTTRITQGDLVSQKPGECRIFCGKKLWHVQAFYGDFKLKDQFKINTYVKLKKSEIDESWSPLSAQEWYKETKNLSHPKYLTKDVLNIIQQQGNHYAKTHP